MASLGSSLSIAVQALDAATAALQVTNNNISNANTPGYSRQIVELNESQPLNDGKVSLGTGVEVTGILSVRDQLVQNQIQQETSAQGGANAQLNSLQAIQQTFTTSTQDIGTEMSALFSSLSSLSTNSTNPSLRASVLTAGQNLATAFNTASSTLTSQQGSLSSQVSNDVSQINNLTQQIAALNPQITEVQATGQDGGTLVDQQNALVLKLAALTNVNVTQGSDGITVSTGNGTLLVSGSKSLALKATAGGDGAEHVSDSNGTDITSTLSGGENGDLGATIYTQQTTIPGLLTQLNTLANQFATAFNQVQTSGTDQNGSAGQAFFNIPTTVAGSAAQISVAISDPAEVAASSDGSSGGDGNLANFSALQTAQLPSGQTPADAYAALVYQVGSLTSTATAESSATTSSLTQLNDQLSSVSGVSVDEESANLIAYQQSYEAAARVVSVIQSLFSVTMSMGTASAA